jgi:hypothetical protein
VLSLGKIIQRDNDGTKSGTHRILKVELTECARSRMQDMRQRCQRKMGGAEAQGWQIHKGN